MNLETHRVRSITVFVALALVSVLVFGEKGDARSSYFFTKGCNNCHNTSTVTCAGCHHHSGTISATKNKLSKYQPGEMVSITLTAAGARSGWTSARLYDEKGTEIGRSDGNQSSKGGASVLPAVISAPAPAHHGKYVWTVTCFGNDNGRGGGDIHGEKVVRVPIVVAKFSKIHARGTN